ncbi:aromatic-ring-hydroxylating dioxygenase subunit beta [Paraburkholderia caribensis]|uniref:aromatic-ring-hydroxylating dioxygenase subunit beta n=1 Tax=Paraburkholderia caribensis TaxID=75105 RepID=UPI0004B0EA61|nr:aromatic-ring-hydroxylating dioxygenase subunit beta [Paraburkholderia caribensis]
MSFIETISLQEAVGVRSKVEQFLYREARLLDDLKLEEWLTLFTEDGLYWVPIAENAPIQSQGAIIYDPPLRREERVYHILQTDFPAQSPRSRTVHFISNVQVEGDEAQLKVSSSQIVYEMRRGDFGQKGIGDITPIVSQVDYILREVNGDLQIAEKKILLINRDTWQGNLTFIL